jgi:type II secretory pathway component GspD/PulD (secretin)
VKLTVVFLAFLLFLSNPERALCQTIRAMDFRSQNITDILMVLAEAGRQSIIVDETVMGTATFHFSDSTFEEALFRFAAACNLFVERRFNAYFVSRVQISRDGELINLNAENVDIEMLVRAISRSAGITIIYDQLPRAVISINSEGARLIDLLEIIIRRYPDYSILFENNAFYIRRAQDTQPAARLSSNSITTRNGLFSINAQRASFSSILTLLFSTGNREYSLLQRMDTTLDNLYFQDREFDQLLRLILEQANCDFVVSNSVYYIFEVQRRDILKQLKDIMVIQLQHISVENAVALIPNEYSASSFMRTDRSTNSVYLTGSAMEITPIADYLAMLDIPAEGKSFIRYEIQFLPVREFISLLPQELARTSPAIIPGSNAFIVYIDEEQQRQFEHYINLVDMQNLGRPVQLRYIRSDELLQFLPPSVTREELFLSADPTLVFYRGSNEKYTQFLEHLRLIDQPKPQIRYQLLVIQYQRSDNINWSRGVTVNSPPAASGTSGPGMFSGSFSNLLNINFDVITEFGYQFALNLNMQIGEDRAKILADTTLNGISGQDIKFQNTTTFRYRDTIIDPDTQRQLTVVTREINSGLVLNINGWVSGDGMITMNVNAAVSKQDESSPNAGLTTNPPPTSERVVNTQVRTTSGTPIVIGGLLQVERAEHIRRLPVLGKIPLLGRLFQDIVIQDSTTEMVIYIIPHVHSGPVLAMDHSRKIEDYFNRYTKKD